MREIKYQVYDRKQKMMFDVTEITGLKHGKGYIRGEQGDSGGECFVTYGYLDKKIGLGPNGTAPIVHRFALRQSTGLKDKNGIEIFEGDIFIIDRYPLRKEDAYVGVVEYDIDRFWGVRTKKPEANVRGISDGIADGLYEFIDDGIEVIGNIFENELSEILE